VEPTTYKTQTVALSRLLFSSYTLTLLSLWTSKKRITYKHVCFVGFFKNEENVRNGLLLALLKGTQCHVMRTWIIKTPETPTNVLPWLSGSVSR
jgi:hypothetical protein